METTMTTLTEADCYNIDRDTEDFLASFAFWTDGVLKSLLTVSGLVGNAIAAFILLRPSMRHSFNLLLASLTFVDSLYLLFELLESVRQRFVSTDTHTELIPHFLYPANKMAMTASVFLTVAIALERYVAVHYPIDYNLAMNEPRSIRRRLLRYLLPVLALSVLFNATKFLEVTIHYEKKEDSSWTPRLAVTSLRTHPYYSAYANWSRLVGLGIIPFALLVFFNGKIYLDIRSRRNRRLAASRFNRPLAPSNNAAVVELMPMVPLNNQLEEPSSTVVVLRPAATSVGTFEDQLEEEEVPQQQQQHQQQPPPPSLQREKRRKAEDGLAVVFMGIILLFLCCHLPRLLLDVHELVTLRWANRCAEARMGGFPAWAIVAVHLSHLTLVLNSATNILVYCGLSSKFREEFRKAVSGN